MKNKKAQIILSQKDYEILLDILWVELTNLRKFRCRKRAEYEKALSRIIRAFQKAEEV